jgi:hypothetical protein
MTLKEIVAAVKKLKPTDLTRLRKQIDQLEAKHWAVELATTTRELRKAGVNDQQIDRMVMRRRRESSS